MKKKSKKKSDNVEVVSFPNKTVKDVKEYLTIKDDTFIIGKDGTNEKDFKENEIKKEQVNSPKHYNTYKVETIEMMQRIWGIDKTIIFCEMNAFKYRMRVGKKDDVNQDLQKEQWYLTKAEELKKELK